MIDLASRYAKLIALAEDQAGTPEGAVAERLAGQLRDRYPDLLADVGEPTTERVVAYRHTFDRTFLGLEAFRVGRHRRDGKGVRWRDALELRGPADLVDLAVEFYRDRRDALDDLLGWTAVGFAQGAFPIEADDDEDQDDEDVRRPATLEALQAAQAGLAAGRRHRPPAEPVPEDRRIAPREIED